MKRLLFLVVSVLVAGATYASNVSKEIIANVTSNGEVSISEQQNQELILEQPADLQLKTNWHYSHSSHRSHSSHSSHRSHYSSRFE